MRQNDFGFDVARAATYAQFLCAALPEDQVRYTTSCVLRWAQEVANFPYIEETPWLRKLAGRVADCRQAGGYVQCKDRPANGIAPETPKWNKLTRTCKAWTEQPTSAAQESPTLPHAH